MTTNRNKLSKMTNEELAEMLGKQNCQYCVHSESVCYIDNRKNCFDGILQWLEQECEENK